MTNGEPCPGDASIQEQLERVRVGRSGGNATGISGCGRRSGNGFGSTGLEGFRSEVGGKGGSGEPFYAIVVRADEF